MVIFWKKHLLWLGVPPSKNSNRPKALRIPVIRAKKSLPAILSPVGGCEFHPCFKQGFVVIQKGTTFSLKVADF